MTKTTDEELCDSVVLAALHLEEASTRTPADFILQLHRLLQAARTLASHRR